MFPPLNDNCMKANTLNTHTCITKLQRITKQKNSNIYLNMSPVSSHKRKETLKHVKCAAEEVLRNSTTRNNLILKSQLIWKKCKQTAQVLNIGVQALKLVFSIGCRKDWFKKKFKLSLSFTIERRV